MNAIGITGMQLYTFGHTVSIPFFTEKWRPYSFLDRILSNYNQNLHTLVLLDIRVKEISDENLLKGKKIYEPPTFMTVNIAISQIIESIKHKKDLTLSNISDIKAIGVARIGAKDQIIKAGSLSTLENYDFGLPLHSLIICAPKLHCIEDEMFDHFSK